MTKTYSEILDDIVAYYATHKRGTRGTVNAALGVNYENGCTYTGCAIGFVCGFKVGEWDSYGSFDDVCYAEGDYVWDKFLPEYRVENEEFWCDVQAFHDVHFHWIENDRGGSDLTEDGMKAFSSLKKKCNEY